MTKTHSSAASLIAPVSRTISPEEVFLELFRKAIDSGTGILENAGLSEESIWSAYRAALALLAGTTSDIDSEARAAIAA
jgi:hypothetical protein